MSRFLSNESSSAETEELQGLLADAPEKQFLLEMLRSYFIPPAVTTSHEELAGNILEEKFLKIIEKGETDTGIPPMRAIRPWRRILALAAVLVPLLGIGIFLLMRPSAGHSAPARQKSMGEVLARAGARTRLVLPDGTRVWLNSSSRLRYTRGEIGAFREVELEGEAYFDVARDPQHPFIVHVDSLDIKVLGTAFNIKSYPQDQTIEATLLKGGIEIVRKDNQDAPRVILRPNEKLVFNKRLAAATLPPITGGTHSASTTSEIVVNSIPKNIPDSNKVETAWMYNRLVFDGDYFRELAEKMERWYNVRIIFRDERLNGYRFGGSFTNETVEQALTALQLTAPFNYNIKDNQIEIYAKK